jgi:O-antigen/teichoic acid export membrane protein
MSRDGLEHRAAKVSLVTGLSSILSVAFQLISVPVCLKYWGQEAYGSWLVLFAAFHLIRSLDAGYIGYVGNKLNYLYHQDREALRKHLSSAVVGVFVIGALQLLIATGVLLSDQLAGALGLLVEDSAAAQGRLGLLILMSSWVLTGAYLGIVHRLLIPAGLMYQAAWWSMSFQVSQFIAIMIVATAQLNLLQTSLLFALSQSVVYLFSALYIRSKLSDYYPWWHGARIDTGLVDLRKSTFLTASSVIQQGSSNGILLLVSAFAGPVVLPLFTTVRTLSNLWTNLTHVLTTPLLPDVVRFHAKGETHKLASTMEAYWVLVGSVVNLSILLVYPLLEGLYGYWTGHTMTLDQSLLCLLLAAVVVTNAGALMAMHLNGINSLRVVLSTSVARAVCALGIGSLFFKDFGLASFGVGIFTGEVAALVIVGRSFVLRELISNGYELRIAVFAPAILGVGSVLLFLAGKGIGFADQVWSLPLSLLGVVMASVWGWSRLNLDLRARLLGMVTDRFGKRF